MATLEINDKEVIDCLNDLLQLDRDAVEAYEVALKKIETPAIHEKIESFKNDHKQHIVDLTSLVKRLHGEPLSPGKDLKGFLIKGMTAVQSAMGEKSALKAIKSNEELTNKMYAKALQENFSEASRALIEKNYADEKRHLAYVESVLAELDNDEI